MQAKRLIAKAVAKIKPLVVVKEFFVCKVNA